jgi:hypothetical protein
VTFRYLLIDEDYTVYGTNDFQAARDSECIVIDTETSTVYHSAGTEPVREYLPCTEEGSDE